MSVGAAWTAIPSASTPIRIVEALDTDVPFGE